MNTPTPEIRKAFYARLIELLPIGSITDQDIAWPNVPFTPSLGRMYIAPYLLYAETQTASLSPAGFERLQGIFQLNVFGVLNDGEGAVEEVARQLTDSFRGGSRLSLTPEEYQDTHILILRTYRSALFVEPNSETARPQIAVSVNWQIYAQKGG